MLKTVQNILKLNKINLICPKNKLKSMSDHVPERKNIVDLDTA